MQGVSLNARQGRSALAYSAQTLNTMSAMTTSFRARSSPASVVLARLLQTRLQAHHHPSSSCETGASAAAAAAAAAAAVHVAVIKHHDSLHLPSMSSDCC
jgi:hypothetical protein